MRVAGVVSLASLGCAVGHTGAHAEAPTAASANGGVPATPPEPSLREQAQAAARDAEQVANKAKATAEQEEENARIAAETSEQAEDLAAAAQTYAEAATQTAAALPRDETESKGKSKRSKAEDANNDDGAMDSSAKKCAPAWGIGAGVLAGVASRRAIQGAFVPLGLSLDAHVGVVVTGSYVTGIGLRGSWLTPLDPKLEAGGRAHDLTLFEGSVYWYQEFGQRWRFGLGPHASTLRGGAPALTDTTLVGAELSAEFGLTDEGSPALLPGVWFGLLASHATAIGSQSSGEHEHQTELKLAVTFALEQAGTSGEGKPEE
jgi:hypothetical protein